jgi:AmmeMemoRadiSam system protein B/AmmeMemoRadiSam system protein A
MRRMLLVILMVCCLLSSLLEPLHAQQKNVRKAYVAGQFYPGTKQELEQQVQEDLAQAKKTELGGALHALVAPHAGYIYSAPIAAYAYKQIDRPFKRVFIFASNHSSDADVDGLSVPAEFTHYATPLGEVRVSAIVQDLMKEKRISYVPAAHTAHVEEVQLPFLQMLLSDFEIIPVVTGRMNLSDIKRFGELFNRYVDDDTLFIVSSDLSHSHPYDEAVRLDTSCIHALERLDSAEVINSELCGQGAALILLEIAKKQGWQGKILDYRNSGDTAGDKSQVVGYSAIAFYTPTGGQTSSQEEQKKWDTQSSVASSTQANALSEAEQKMLLELAKTTLELYVNEKKEFEPEPDRFAKFPKLLEQRGTFVTLKKNKELRGCIGNLIGRQPVYLSVRDNAISAAIHDPRFTPVTKDELPEISLSISVLDVPKLLWVASPDEYLEKLTHEDGVILVSGSHQSTYLPQVWEQIPNSIDFLSNLCVKGGAQSDCWKEPDTQLYIYHAQEFGEGD